TVCHAIRREPDEAARQAMIADFWAAEMPLRMQRNARGLQQKYHLLLWMSRLRRWRKSAPAQT
ncbi:MAG TPA: glycosyltransferase, partial [Erwinia persicina]|nr:glycosyltransferase [Erwinia persicina]